MNGSPLIEALFYRELLFFSQNTFLVFRLVFLFLIPEYGQTGQQKGLWDCLASFEPCDHMIQPRRDATHATLGKVIAPVSPTHRCGPHRGHRRAGEGRRALLSGMWSGLRRA